MVHPIETGRDGGYVAPAAPASSAPQTETYLPVETFGNSDGLPFTAGLTFSDGEFTDLTKVRGWADTKKTIPVAVQLDYGRDYLSGDPQWASCTLIWPSNSARVDFSQPSTPNAHPAFVTHADVLANWKLFELRVTGAAVAIDLINGAALTTKIDGHVMKEYEFFKIIEDLSGAVDTLTHTGFANNDDQSFVCRTIVRTYTGSPHIDVWVRISRGRVGDRAKHYARSATAMILQSSIDGVNWRTLGDPLDDGDLTWGSRLMHGMGYGVRYARVNISDNTQTQLTENPKGIHDFTQVGPFFRKPTATPTMTDPVAACKAIDAFDLAQTIRPFDEPVHHPMSGSITVDPSRAGDQNIFGSIRITPDIEGGGHRIRSLRKTLYQWGCMCGTWVKTDGTLARDDVDGIGGGPSFHRMVLAVEGLYHTQSAASRGWFIDHTGTFESPRTHTVPFDHKKWGAFEFQHVAHNTLAQPYMFYADRGMKMLLDEVYEKQRYNAPGVSGGVSTWTPTHARGIGRLLRSFSNLLWSVSDSTQWDRIQERLNYYAGWAIDLRTQNLALPEKSPLCVITDLPRGFSPWQHAIFATGILMALNTDLESSGRANLRSDLINYMQEMEDFVLDNFVRNPAASNQWQMYYFVESNGTKGNISGSVYWVSISCIQQMDPTRLTPANVTKRASIIYELVTNRSPGSGIGNYDNITRREIGTTA